MPRKLEITTKRLVLISLILIISAGVLTAVASPAIALFDTDYSDVPAGGHGGDTVIIKMQDGTETTLQGAIDTGLIGGTSSSLECVVETAGPSMNVVVPCPEGYTITGGGYNGALEGSYIVRNHPEGNAWHCQRSGGSSSGTTCYAVCCK